MNSAVSIYNGEQYKDLLDAVRKMPRDPALVVFRPAASPLLVYSRTGGKRGAMRSGDVKKTCRKYPANRLVTMIQVLNTVRSIPLTGWPARLSF